MKRYVSAIGVLILLVGVLHAQKLDPRLKAATEKYDRAFQHKDVESIRSLLAPDVLLYEHSIRNDGLQDVFENHLKPEILEFEDLKVEFTDVRITPGKELALLTRQYRIQGKLSGRDINASGNETMVWKKAGPDWRIAHIHYSHPCPRPTAPKGGSE